VRFDHNRKISSGTGNEKLRGSFSCGSGGKQHVPSEPIDAEYWLERAREAYALSDQMAYSEAKRLMREIAASYQRLAQTTHERTGRAKPRSS
jgi:hypothetical protein